jgi:hypothetical protein
VEEEPPSFALKARKTDHWFKFEFWRFVLVQQQVMKTAQTFIDFPPMQKGASFNMEAVKEQIQRALQSHAGQ